MPKPPDPNEHRFDLDQLQLALSMSGVTVWRMDVGTNRIYSSALGTDLMGIPPPSGGWDAPNLVERMHPDDRAAVIAAAHRARQTGRPVDLVTRVMHPDGLWHQILTRRMAMRDAAGHLVAFLGMAIDVTERYQAEEQLREANQRIALIARSAGIGTWEWVLPDGPSRWDEQMYLMRGLEPREGAPSIEEMTSYLHPDDRDYVSQQILLAVGGHGPTQYEFRIIRPDGQVRWLASRSVPMHDEQGRIVRRIGVNWDISAGREAEGDRQAKAIALRESEAKSELLARMSHELRTPLNAVLGFTELLLADGDSLDAASRRVRLEHVRSAGQHLLALINDVLELARPDDDTNATHPMATVVLDPVFDASLPLVERAASARRILLSHEASLPPGLAALADPLWLKQVLLNLLTNAVKYNREGGWVSLSARAVSDEQVCITVRDGGLGMSPELLDQAFEPFHRAPDRHPGVPGVGIGLAVVKTLMERMSGRISVRSTAGQGSEFELWLPRAAGDPAAAGESPNFVRLAGRASAPAAGVALPSVAGVGALEADAGDSTAARRPVLLYIEDNPVNLMIVEELAARRTGLAFHSAADGETGLRLAAELQPALILLDMQLPDLHGLEVMARLRKDPATQRIPCIALSANAMPEDIRLALATGFADYWTKPLDFAVFNQAMDAMFGPTAG
ncbi:MAG: PAS domain-containing protein [Vitreoscilla sp.]|nr:PAS domain-containing protein [Vitreoscilla sp.]